MKDYFKRIRQQELGQIIRFGLVGIINTIVGYGTYLIFLSLGLHFTIASLFSQIIGTVCSYLLNRKFTFGSKNKVTTELPKFISVYVVQYFCNILFTWIAIRVLGQTPQIAGFISLCICTIGSYMGHRFWSFRKG